MDLKNGIFHGKPVYILAIFLLIAALILSLCWAVTMGAANLSVKDVYGVILYKTLGIGDAELYGSGSLSDIVWFIRLPRLVLAICVGAALAVSGVVMQAIVKNPLADPYILGVSSGASWVPPWQSCWVWERPLGPTMWALWPFWGRWRHLWVCCSWQMWADGQPLSS